MTRLEQKLKLKLNPEFHCRLCSISVTSAERVLTLTAAFLGGEFEECNNDIRGMVSQIALEKHGYRRLEIQEGLKSNKQTNKNSS